MIDYIKVDDKTMKTTSTSDTLYDYSELLKQKEQLENTKEYTINRITADYDSRIAEVDALIAECVKLKLVKPTLEPVVIEEVIK